MKTFIYGFKSMLPITAGIIPFGIVMGSVCSEVGLELMPSVTMNFLVFAGAAQLAALDLLTKNTETFVVILTGLMINLRFMLYSAALSPVVQNSSFLVKLLASYCLTDQNYSVMTAHKQNLPTTKEMLQFYFGASLCMILAWQGAVVAGILFGNIAPKSLSLEFAVPLSFLALVMPTLKGWQHWTVALGSAVASMLFYSLPFNLGLILTALGGIALGAALSREKAVS